MRRVSASLILAFAGSCIWACSSSSANYQSDASESSTNSVGGTATTGATQSANTVSTATGTTNSNTGASTVTATNAVSGTVTGSTSTTGFGGASTGTGALNNATNGTGGTGTETCTDTPPDDRQTCSTWAEWGECGADWLAEFCHASCGRCTSQTSGNPSTAAGGASSTTNAGNNTSNTSNTSTTGALGDDNPWGEVNGGQSGWASRYWDCCKASCGWSANAQNPVSSCDQSDNNIGVNDMRQNACTGGDSYTCHSMAPWAYSNKVSFGYAAVHAQCGQCFHLQFTGSAANGGNGPGAAALAGKHMIVMATNIGDIQQGQFDLLIPGGGVGQFNGCSQQWGVETSQLGAQYGGFLTECRNQDHNATKTCMRNKCDSIFGSRGLTELYDGCMWFVEWFEAADNPDFRYEQVDCPQQLLDGAR